MQKKHSFMFQLFCIPLAFWGCSDCDSSTTVNSDSGFAAEFLDDLPVLKKSAVELDGFDVKNSYGFITDDRDGQVYKIVTIGSQTWMAENLNYADSVKTPSLKGRSSCYDNDPEKCAAMGRLYTWAAAIDSVALAEDAYNPQICGYGKACDRLVADALAKKPIQGICPSGWHLPSSAEWKTLFVAVDGSDTTGKTVASSNAGKALKSTSGWFSDGNGTDAYGFSALPAGYWYIYGNKYYYEGNYAYFWSASQYEDDVYYAYKMRLRYYLDEAWLSYFGKSAGYSVRCIKN